MAASTPLKSDTAPLATPRAWQGRLLVLTSALMWSTSGYFAKARTFDGWPGPLLGFWRAVFASVVLVPLVRRPAWSWWLAPMVLSFVAMNWTSLSAMKEGTAAAAIWLQSTAPVWVLLVGVGLLGEKLHRRDSGLIGLGLAGVLVILYFELQQARPWAVVYGLTSGIFYAAVVICLRRLRDMDAVWLAALNHVCTAVCLLPYFLLAQKLPSGWQWGYLAAFGMFQMGIPYVLFACGLRQISGHEAGGICLIEPVLVPIWTWLAWQEQAPWHIIAGGSLIFLGLAWRYLGVRETPRDAPSPIAPPPPG